MGLHQSTYQWKSRCVVLVLAILILPLGRLHSEDLSAQRSKLDEQFAGQLKVLAETCDKHKLAEQATVTRQWIIRRDPLRQYVFLRSEPDRKAAGIVASWQRKFLELRQERAGRLFDLAKSSLDADQPTRAYQLLHEVLREDPTHADARRVLGIKKAVRPIAKAARLEHGLFRWQPPKHWRVYTEHFEISTNHSSREGLELGQRLEDLYSTWQQLFFPYWSNKTALASWFERGRVPAGRRNKHKVVLFKNRAEYQQAMKTFNSVPVETEGIYLDKRGEVWLYVGGEVAKRTSFHEVTHQLFHESIRTEQEIGTNDNFWIIEGIALYMESLAQRDGYATVGGFDARRLQFARYWVKSQGFYMPLDELTALGKDALQRHDNVQALYSQSAGLTHFLMDFDGGKYRDAVTTYLKLMYSGNQRRDSLEKLTGAEFAQLDALYRNNLNVNDTDLREWLNPPEHVTVLLLGGTDVTDEGLKSLANYNQLEWLDLMATQTTDAGLAHIAGLKNLRELWLTGTAVTDDGLAHLGQLTKLERLVVEKTRVTPAGLAKLKRSLPALKDD